MSKIDVPRGEGGKWLPGVSPNPYGRPPSEYSMRALIKLKAETDAARVYEMLITKATEGDVRAIECYYKLLDKCSADTIVNPFKDGEAKDTNELLMTLLRALVHFKEFTFSQVMTLFDTANKIKLTENVEKETLAQRLPNDKLVAIMKMLQEDQIDKMEDDK